MGGYFAITSKRDCIPDVFFGTDYHSHLGTKRAGMASFDETIGMQRVIHNIQNSPFRTKFEKIFDEMKGNAAIGCISDGEPQPLIIRSRLGAYAISVIGVVNNAKELTEKYLNLPGSHFDAMTGGVVNMVELVSALICEKKSFLEGIKFAQNQIDGTAAIIILKEGGNIICARDKFGRLPMIIGKNKNGHSVAFESFAFRKLGYKDVLELGPGEIVEITPDEIIKLSPPRKKMKICSFLWSYYGYPTATYEGVNVEMMRCRNGELLAEKDIKSGIIDKIDSVSGVPDSGTPHAVGYANRSHKQFARPYIKYTPTWSRSFTPSKQSERTKVAQMKQIPVLELIKGKNLLFVDDSIVRGTQLKETVDFLYENGAKSVHMRSACPPIMFGCKYLNFTRATSDMELITRRVIMELEGEEGFNHLEEYADSSTERGKKLRESICSTLHFDSLEFQSLDDLIKAIGLPKCKLCTYCWNGKE